MRIFHDLIKTQTDGVPDDLSSLELWQTDLTSREPTEKESKIASRLTLLIEEEAHEVIYKLLFDFIDDPAVSACLYSRMAPIQAFRMAPKRRVEKTLLFESALQAAPKKSTKDILRDLEASGKIEDIGDHYLIVDSNSDRDQWKRVKKTSLDSKLSRLRRQEKKRGLPGLA